MKLTSFQSLKKRLLKDPKVREEYEKLGPEFEFVCALIDRRIKRGFTQAALAKKVGTKQSAIARLESGFSNPTFALLNQVADALDAQVKILFIDKKPLSSRTPVRSAR